ncbi:MAG: prepilin-type N-terminal cleavage/methylation domain-containing protein [Patescibacteria group bacterium]|nr:prepilin-type N-terminal cleavage/methylation domain-containing protein [Patescibacteria group bacterium]
MNNLKLKNNRGFSLIELLVSIAILVIVSGLVFFNQSGFNNNVLLENLTYEISLTIRQAQSYGLQSKESSLGDFEAGFGVFFDMSINDNMILYADNNKNHLYDSGSDTIVDTLKLKNSNIIERLCVGSPCIDTNILDISFVRPNPTAYINTSVIVNRDIAEIYIKSPQLQETRIVVNKIGQISIE